jgi:hypothetical protein
MSSSASLIRRLAMLELRMDPPAPKVWHQLIVDIGDTEDRVRAQYESEHGPLGDDPCIVWRII